MNEWTTTDAAIFRDFLDKPTGKKLMEAHLKCPHKVEAKSFEEVAMEAKVIAGWEMSHAWLEEKANYNPTPERPPAFIEGMERD